MTDIKHSARKIPIFSKGWCVLYLSLFWFEIVSMRVHVYSPADLSIDHAKLFLGFLGFLQQKKQKATSAP